MSEWISVKERLPKLEEVPLGCVVYGKAHRGGILRDYQCCEAAIFFGDRGEVIFYRSADNAYMEVTHWMPLPAPPKTAAE